MPTSASSAAPSEARTITAGFHAALDAVAAIPRFVIAAVSGYALGGGCELALACDYRIAGERAVFGQPEVLLGIIPGGGGTQRLPRLIGPSRAKEMMITGRQVKAEEALRIGLADEVVPSEALHDARDRAGGRGCPWCSAGSGDDQASRRRRTRRAAGRQASSWSATCSSRCSTRPTVRSAFAASWSTAPATPSSPVPDVLAHTAQATRPISIGLIRSAWHGTARTVTPYGPGLADRVRALEGAVARVLQRDRLGRADERSRPSRSGRAAPAP